MTLPSSHYTINTVNVLNDDRIIITGGSNSENLFLHEIAMNNSGTLFTSAIYMSALLDNAITSIIQLQNGRVMATSGVGTQSKIFIIYI